MDISAIRAFAIKAGADPESLIKRPLTWDEYSAMSDPEQHFHCVANSKAVDAVHEAHSSEVANVQAETRTKVRKIATYDVEDKAALANTMISTGGRFSVLFPQFVASRANTDKVLKYMRDNSLLPDDVDNFVTAFHALANSGEISIDPSQTGLTDDSRELTGERLQDAINSNPLLLSKATPDVVQRRRLMRMPTKDFDAYLEKTNPKPLPWLINQRVKQDFTTLAANHPEFRFNSDSNKEKLLAYLNEHTDILDSKSIEAAFQALKAAGELDLNPDVRVHAEHATWTDFSQVEPKLRTDKQESLNEKIGRMNADEFQEFISKPANRRAVDSL